MTKKQMDADLLASLDADMQAKVAGYYQAKEAIKAMDDDYRRILADRRLAQNAVYVAQEAIGVWEYGKDKSVQPWKPGMIVLNLRNRRYYEVLPKNPQSSYLHFQPLVAATAKTAKMGATYSQWGPLIIVPPTHPFALKRVNAKLAERLEGKGE